MKAVINQLKKHIPEEPNWNYFIRYGNYKVLVPKKGPIQVFNQTLEGKNDKDIADEIPELVKKISTYIYDNQPKKKKFSIDSL